MECTRWHALWAPRCTFIGSAEATAPSNILWNNASCMSNHFRHLLRKNSGYHAVPPQVSSHPDLPGVCAWAWPLWESLSLRATLGPSSQPCTALGSYWVPCTACHLSGEPGPPSVPACMHVPAWPLMSNCIAWGHKLDRGGRFHCLAQSRYALLPHHKLWCWPAPVTCPANFASSVPGWLLHGSFYVFLNVRPRSLSTRLIVLNSCNLL